MQLKLKTKTIHPVLPLLSMRCTLAYGSIRLFMGGRRRSATGFRPQLTQKTCVCDLKRRRPEARRTSLFKIDLLDSRWWVSFCSRPSLLGVSLFRLGPTMRLRSSASVSIAIVVQVFGVKGKVRGKE